MLSVLARYTKKLQIVLGQRHTCRQHKLSKCSRHRDAAQAPRSVQASNRTKRFEFNCFHGSAQNCEVPCTTNVPAILCDLCDSGIQIRPSNPTKHHAKQASNQPTDTDKRMLPCTHMCVFAVTLYTTNHLCVRVVCCFVSSMRVPTDPPSQTTGTTRSCGL